MNDSKTNPTVGKIIGKNLKILRVCDGITQKEVGKVLGVSFQQVQKYEGALNRISGEDIYHLSKFFGVSVTAFFKSLSIDYEILPDNEAREISKKLRKITCPVKRKKIMELISLFNEEESQIIEGSIEMK